MKKYCNFLSAIMLSLVSLHMDARHYNLKTVEVSPSGIKALKLEGRDKPVEDLWHETLDTEAFIQIFITGEGQNVTLNFQDLEDVGNMLAWTSLTQKEVKQIFTDINEDRLLYSTLKTNQTGAELFKETYVVYKDIVGEFVVGSLKQITQKSDIKEAIKINFDIPGKNVTEKNNYINPLLDLIEKAQALGAPVFLLSQAYDIANALVEYHISRKTPLSAAEKKFIEEQIKASTHQNFISNLQTLVLDKNIQHNDPAFFKDLSDRSNDWIQEKMLDNNTKWSSSQIVLSANAAKNGVTLNLIREMIFAVALVFNNPKFNFHSSGNLISTNYAQLKTLGEFLMQHMGVKIGYSAPIEEFRDATVYDNHDNILKLPSNLNEIAVKINQYL